MVQPRGKPKSTRAYLYIKEAARKRGYVVESCVYSKRSDNPGGWDVALKKNQVHSGYYRFVSGRNWKDVVTKIERLTMTTDDGPSPGADYEIHTEKGVH